MDVRRAFFLAPQVKPLMNTYHQHEKIYRAIYYFWLIDFLAFFIIALIIGGDAVSGYAKDGFYYLMHNAIYTRVSYPVFLYSTIHVYVAIITQIIMFVTALLWHIDKNSPPAGRERSKVHHKRIPRREQDEHSTLP
jgi:hypothetical protein